MELKVIGGGQKKILRPLDKPRNQYYYQHSKRLSANAFPTIPQIDSGTLYLTVTYKQIGPGPEQEEIA